MFEASAIILAAVLYVALLTFLLVVRIITFVLLCVFKLVGAVVRLIFRIPNPT